jgi:hypothetical protein
MNLTKCLSVGWVGYIIYPSIGSHIDETQAVENVREEILPGIMKKQSKSLSAKVVTRREP